MATNLPTITPLIVPFANEGDKSNIPLTQAVPGSGQASLVAGFPTENSIAKANGGIPPFRGDMNAALYLATQYGYFSQCGGIHTFNETVATYIGGYAAGAVLMRVESNGNIRLVKSLVNNNTWNFNVDGVDGSHWAYVSGFGQDANPVGTIIAFAGSGTPSGNYLYCNGNEVPQSTYADLYSAIGNSYGAAQTTGYFKLPDLRGNFIQGIAASGENVGLTKQAGIPNITGVLGNDWNSKASSQSAVGVTQITGAFGLSENTGIGVDDGSLSTNDRLVTFDASRSSAVYGRSSTVQPPAVVMKFWIKY